MFFFFKFEKKRRERKHSTIFHKNVINEFNLKIKVGMNLFKYFI